MHIALLLKDEGYNKIDMSRPDKGNPGIGGSEFDVLMLAYYLPVYINEITITIYHYNPSNILPTGVQDEIITSDVMSMRRCKEDDVDIYIFNGGGRYYKQEWYRMIDELGIKTICWIHNHAFYDELEDIKNTKGVKAVVFVSRQLYDRYVDHQIIKKSTFIYNMFNSEYKAYGRYKDFPNWVTYTGSIIPSKGFHILARQWKNIVSECPDAELHILGSGKLYNRDSKLGKYGIAQKEYENEFMPYLTNEAGRIFPSVVFHGILGNEKSDIYNKTAVGVINPSGVSETLGMSAIEMEAHGVPIVTRKIGGLCDAVKDGSTGYLIRNEKELCQKVVDLIKNKGKNVAFGNRAKEYVSVLVSPERMSEKWNEVFECILEGKGELEYIKPSNYYLSENKWLRIIIHNLRKVIPNIPSLYQISHFLRRRKY